jgi:hypothetical protein
VQVECTNGDKVPKDITKAEINQTVIVDTQRPTLRILDAERQGEFITVRWDGQEEYPDLQSLKLEFHNSEMPAGVFMKVSMESPALKGQTTFKSGTGPVALRMQIKDLAGNASFPATLELADDGSSQNETAKGNPKKNAKSDPKINSDFKPADATGPKGSDTSKGWSPGAVPAVAASRTSRIPHENDDADRVPVRGGGDYRDGSTGQLVASTSGGQVGGPNLSGGSSRNARGMQPKSHLINNRKLNLEYEVAKIGPSGIGGVDVYLSKDDGQRWEKYNQENAEPVSNRNASRHLLPLELPGEGRFGVYLVIKSGVGLGKAPPRDGDLPQMMIEVDETAPEASLYAPEPDPKQKDSLVIRWQASDANLGDRPITLEWSDKPNGVWKLIAKDLPNLPSQYSWKLPLNVPAQVFLRLTVTDAAGNAAKAETPQPITVDLNEPELQFIGIAGPGR